MIAAVAAAALLAAPAFQSPQDLQRWLTYYYLEPRPELILPSFPLLDQQIEKAVGQSLADQASRGGMRSFYAQAFAHNDKVVAEVARTLRDLPPSQQPFVREALRRCGTRACARALGEPTARAVAPPADVEEAVADLWGAFAATGDEKFVRAVIAQVVAGKAPRLSLRANAYQHARVLQVCEKVMAESQGSARTVLDDIVGFARAEREQNPPAEPR
jgi:hypothetical protein